MASQQSAPGTEQADLSPVRSPCVPDVSTTDRGEAILADDKPETTNPVSNISPYELPPNDELLLVDQMMCDVLGILGTARKTLAGFSVYAQRHVAYERAYYDEQKSRIEFALAYGTLHDEHNKTIGDLHSMHTKCLSLHRELESLQSAKDEQKSEPRIDGININPSNEVMQAWALEKERFEVKIADLEKEKTKMAEEHHLALLNAVDHIREVTERAKELENRNEMYSEHLQPSISEHKINTGPDSTDFPKRRVSKNRKRKQVPRK